MGNVFEIPLVVIFASQPKPAARGFRCLRSDQNCRLLSRNQVGKTLELTLCSQTVQSTPRLFPMICAKKEYCAAHCGNLRKTDSASGLAQMCRSQA
jgi:hypothetical protein